MTSEEHRFPCDTCGADMRFAPQDGELVCDHCGNIQDIGVDRSTAPLRELDYRSVSDAGSPPPEQEEIRVSSCPNCGALVEFDPSIHATECPFCATPVVIGTGTHHQIKPRGVLPFSLSEPDGQRAMNTWLGSLWFAPNGLKAYARKGRKLSGVYMPHWTYDAMTNSQYKGQRGKIYYVTERVTRNGKTETRRVQKIRWHSASGAISRWFDDVLVPASTSLPEDFIEALTPWDLGALEPYQPEYLAGFRAESYTVDISTGFGEARKKMDQVIRRDVKFDIGGDRQRVDSVQTHISDVTFKHILLPVWLAAYKYRGKTYRFVVNGRTGRVHGERPWSAWKIALTIILIALIAGTIGYFLSQQQST